MSTILACGDTKLYVTSLDDAVETGWGISYLPQ